MTAYLHQNSTRLSPCLKALRPKEWTWACQIVAGLSYRGVDELATDLGAI
jgi:hypothetical protein